MMVMLGLAVGNYATSIVFRLPRGLKISNDPPYCDSCRTYLRPRDLFPFFSWVINKGRCRFCAVRIPALYACVEWASACLCVAALFRFGLGDAMLVFLMLGMGWVILAAQYHEHQRIYAPVMVGVLGASLLWRVLTDGTLEKGFEGAMLGLCVALLCYAVVCLRARAKVLPPPTPLMMPVLAGLSLTAQGLLWWLPLTAGLALVCTVLARYDSRFTHSRYILSGATALVALCVVG
jgi:prepilin signal peptidase PulO-like enzyme (type II secretory pathway)